MVINWPMTSRRWLNTRNSVERRPLSTANLARSERRFSLLKSIKYLTINCFLFLITKKSSLSLSPAYPASPRPPLDEPICLREEIFEANIGDSININCSIDASPSNCSYLWNVPELHLLRHTDRPLLHPLNESTLLYKVSEQLDFGSIKCQATNWIGKSTCEHFVLPKASKLNGRPAFDFFLFVCLQF